MWSYANVPKFNPFDQFDFMVHLTVMEVEDAKIVITENPKQLPFVVATLHPYHYFPSVLHATILSGDVEILQWFLAYMKQRHTETKDYYCPCI